MYRTSLPPLRCLYVLIWIEGPRAHGPSRKLRMARIRVSARIRPSKNCRIYFQAAFSLERCCCTTQTRSVFQGSAMGTTDSASNHATTRCCPCRRLPSGISALSSQQSDRGPATMRREWSSDRTLQRVAHWRLQPPCSRGRAPAILETAPWIRPVAPAPEAFAQDKSACK